MPPQASSSAQKLPIPQSSTKPDSQSQLELKGLELERLAAEVEALKKKNREVAQKRAQRAASKPSVTPVPAEDELKRLKEELAQAEQKIKAAEDAKMVD